MGGANVPLKDLPPYLPKAFIAIEDRRFYSHYGVDPIGIARAAVANVLHRGVSQGGSTLTQQLAKNLFLTQERTLSASCRRWCWRCGWSANSKDEILELYLNRVYFGSGAYGVEAAAQRYFGKSRARTSRSPKPRCSRASSSRRRGSRRTAIRKAPSARADRARGDGDAKFITEAQAKAAIGSIPPTREAGRRRLGQLRRRLDHGRARRSGRPRRPGHRGRDHDRSALQASPKRLVDELAQKASSSTSPRARWWR
jgi:penicillin-binding protein 1A